MDKSVDKPNTLYYVAGLFIFYIFIFIIHQFLLLNTYKSIITWDSLSYLILTICILLPLSILFNEVDFYGFKLKREFNEFRNDVSKTLSIMQSASMKQQMNLNVINKGPYDVDYQPGVLGHSDLLKEKEEEQ